MYKVLGRFKLKKLKSVNKNELLKKAAIFIFAALLSKGRITGDIFPFGGAFIAAAPGGYAVQALLGATVGYLIFSGAAEPLEYISVCIAAAGVRWALSDLKRIYKSEWFAPANAFFSYAFTRILLAVSAGDTSFKQICFIFAEGAVAAVCTYIFKCTFTAIKEKTLASDGGVRLCACFISCLIALICIVNIRLAGFSFCRALIIAGILLCSYCKKIPAGAVAGISGAAALSLAGDDMAYISLAYALGGMGAGAAARYGRLATCGAYIFISFCAAFMYSGLDYMSIMMLEAAAGCAVFILIPKRVTAFVNAAVNRAQNKGSEQALRRLLSTRITLSAKAFADIGEKFDLTGKNAEKKSEGEKGQICDTARKKVCSCCPKREMCKSDEAFAEAERCLLLKPEGDISELPQFFKTECIKKESVYLALSRACYDQTAKKELKKRTADMRRAVSGQFTAISELFFDINEELLLLGAEDTRTAEALEKRLRAKGIMPDSVIVRTLRGDRLSVEITGRAALSVSAVEKIISGELKVLTGQSFFEPLISAKNGKFIYKGNRSALYRAEFGIASKSKNNSRFCGDSYDFFYDGKGGAVAVLSDGMGTGGRAAADSSVICGLFSRIVTAGASFKSAINIVNSTLASRPGEESAATLDVCRIDLCTGKTEFCKAGAPYTYIKSENGGENLQMQSLPVGILECPSIARSVRNLSEGDIVVLMSDGAAERAADFIDTALVAGGQCAQDIAERILNRCIACDEGEQDDMTVLVLRIKSAADTPAKKTA